MRSLLLLGACVGLVAGMEVPLGLKPAKAVDDEPDEDTVGPLEPIAPENSRAPPNLSLRSRHLAALNTQAEASIDSENSQVETESKPPVVFSRKNSSKKAEKSKPSTESGPSLAESSSRTVPRVTGPPPPAGNYGMNTILQTNLVDSKGRVLKGVKSVPIRVPSTEDIKKAKHSRASVSPVEIGASKVVPIEFGGTLTN